MIAAKTKRSQTRAVDRLEVERIKKINRPQRFMLRRKTKKGLLATCCLPLVTRTIISTRVRMTSIRGIIR